MKGFFSYIVLLLMSVAVFAQEPPKQQVEPMDTIVLISGRKVLGKVQMVSSSKITHIPKDKNDVVDIDRKQVQLIIYRNGKVERFNTPAVELVDEGNWKTIVLTDQVGDVDGLFNLGSISAQSSPKSRTAKSAQRSADIRMQKMAAAMGGIMILVKKRESKGGYGEVPTHLVEGDVYGFDPPADKK